MTEIKTKAGNQVNVIFPYRGQYGIWAFDDEDVNLNAEPFVGNINVMIDMLVDYKTKGTKEATVYISKDPIAEGNVHLQKVHSPDNSPEPGWYKLKGTNMTGWLCPALLNYFDGYPDNIYAKISPR